VIHSAIHAGRHDAKCVLHTHTAAGIAVATQRAGLLPISQHSLFVLSTVMSRPWDFDLEALHGPQEMTDEDRAYRGSRYSDVRKALYANPYRDGASGQMPGPLPMFRSTIRNAWQGAFRGPNKLKQASARSLDSRADLRWGADRKGYRRILAPNGICVLGTWEITAETPYSGYFRTGAKGLTIGRLSSTATRPSEASGLISLGMKIIRRRTRAPDAARAGQRDRAGRPWRHARTSSTTWIFGTSRT
jgi:hypothetical protein